MTPGHNHGTGRWAIAERERLEALEDAAKALGKKLRTMARDPEDPPDDHRQASTEALDAWRDTFGGLIEARR